MSRLQGVCIGDCSKCELLANGEVDMIPCVLDQIFQRVQRNERNVDFIMEKMSASHKVSFVSVNKEKAEENDNELQTDA